MKKYIKNNFGTVIFLIALYILDSAAIAGIPLVTKAFIDYISEINIKIILIFSALYVGDVLLILLFEYLCQTITAKVYRNIIFEMREDLFEKIFTKSYRDYYKFDTDYYSNICLNDLGMLYGDYFSNIFEFAMSIISFVVYSICALFISWVVALVIIASSLLTLLLPNLVGKKLADKRKKQSDGTKDYMSALKDLLQGYSLNNKYTHEKFVGVHRFYNRKKEALRYGFEKYQSFVHIFSGAMLYVINIATFVTGILLINFNMLSLSAFVAMLSYVELIVIPSRDVAYEIMGIKSSKEIRDKLLAVLNGKSDGKVYAPHAFSSDITLNNVSFSYGDEAVLSGVSLKFEKGKRYAVVGKTGSGKTTLINLILGRLDNFKGSITYDGIDINDIDIPATCSVINQNNFIFNASAKDNITLFGAYEDSGLYDMVKEIGAENILKDNLGEFGSKLSGGEKRKIEILRAMMRKSPVFIGDEIFAGVDENTEKDIKKFLSSREMGVTHIEITHDISDKNLRSFDEVIILKDHKVEKIISGSLATRAAISEII